RRASWVDSSSQALAARSFSHDLSPTASASRARAAARSTGSGSANGGGAVLRRDDFGASDCGPNTSAVRPITVSSSGSYWRSSGTRIDGVLASPAPSRTEAAAAALPGAPSRSSASSLSAGIVTCAVRGSPNGSNSSPSGMSRVGSAAGGRRKGPTPDRSSRDAKACALVTISSLSSPRARVALLDCEPSRPPAGGGSRRSSRAKNWPRPPRDGAAGAAFGGPSIGRECAPAAGGDARRSSRGIALMTVASSPSSDRSNAGAGGAGRGGSPLGRGGGTFGGRYSGRDAVFPDSPAGLSETTSFATSGTKFMLSQSESAESQSISAASSGPFFLSLSSVMRSRAPASAAAPSIPGTGRTGAGPPRADCPARSGQDARQTR